MKNKAGWALPAIIFIAVLAAALALRPGPAQIVWERIRPKPETALERASLDAAANRPNRTLAAGAYVFEQRDGANKLTATFTFPAGVTTQSSPFEYDITLAFSGKTERRSVTGQATITGDVLNLYPEAKNTMTNYPVDRNLLNVTRPSQFSIVSPSDRTPGRDSETLFRRKP